MGVCCCCATGKDVEYVDISEHQQDLDDEPEQMLEEVDNAENEKAKLLNKDERKVDRVEQSGLGSFVNSYAFNTKQTIILQHYFGQSVANDDGQLNKNGDYTDIAEWDVQFDGEEDDCLVVKFKNTSNGKYLRIIEDDQQSQQTITDCLGSGGTYSRFKVHETNENLFKFESCTYPNAYIAVSEQGVVVNNGDEFSKFSIWSKQTPKGDQSGFAAFVNPYGFNTDNKKVIMKHYFGKTLTLTNENESELNPNGAFDSFAQFCIEFDGALQDNFVITKIKSIKSGKYIRIIDDKINCLGNGGKYTLFKVHKTGANSYKFESCTDGNKYIGVATDDVVIGSGDDLCEFTLWSDEIDRKQPENEEKKAAEEEEDGEFWYDNIEEVSLFIKKQRKKDKKIEFSSGFWKELNAKKAKKLDVILKELGEFVGVTKFDLRMSLWERVDSKRKRLNTLSGLEKLLYQLVIEYINQKDKKRTKPQEKNVKAFMQYLAVNIVGLENFPQKQKQEMDKEQFARGIDNWMTALIEEYKGE